VETYGGQEGVVTTVNSADWLAHPGTVGRVDRVPVRVYDDKGDVLGPGEVGNVYAALGDVEYYHAPEKTAASRHGDFFTLGDVGYVDAEGWLYLVDRRVDLIISGGVNIYPAEVEAVLMQHKAVRDVAVIGVPNPEWGHEVRAVVEPADSYTGSDELQAQLIDFCRAHVARYKCPRSVVFMAGLPRDSLGKLQRWQLREALR
jgi:long-chain acyl-CoA synthetase